MQGLYFRQPPIVEIVRVRLVIGVGYDLGSNYYAAHHLLVRVGVAPCVIAVAGMKLASLQANLINLSLWYQDARCFFKGKLISKNIINGIHYLVI